MCHYWPRRVYRIRLLLRGLGVEAVVRMLVQDLNPGKPGVVDRPEPFPRQAVPLATAPKRVQPTAGRLPSERIQADGVAGDRKVVEVPLHHASQPLPKVRDRF